MLFFIFGLFLGSFLNNIALRLEKGESFLFSRSKCPHCGKILSWKELIPLLSFILQKGKCTNCQSKISLRYPLIELLTGVWVYLLSYSLKTNLSVFSLIEFAFYLILLSTLFALALYDLKTFLVDDRLIIFGIFSALVFIFYKNFFNLPSRDFSYLLNYFFPSTKFEPLISAVISSFFFLFVFLITKGKGMGFGDVKVAFLIGLFLKPGDALLSVMLSFFYGSIYGIYLILKNKRFGQVIPFIPFFFLGVLTTILLGEKIIKIYFDIFKI